MVSSSNFSKEFTLNRLMGKNKGTKIPDFLRVRTKTKKVGLHYYIYAPFGGVGNVIKSGKDKNAKVTVINKLDNDPAAAHIFFRPNLEHHINSTIPRSLMVGFENSPPGKDSASGQAHNINSVLKRNKRSAAAMGSKWKSLQSTILDAGQPFHGVPSENGGKIVSINGRRQDLIYLFEQADNFVKSLQEGNEQSSDILWNLLLTEHQPHRLQIARALGIDYGFMATKDLEVELVDKHRHSKFVDNWQSTCFLEKDNSQSKKRLEKNIKKCKSIFKSGMEYLFHYIEWLHGEQHNLLMSAQGSYFENVVAQYEDDPTTNIPYFTAYKTIVLYYGLTLINAINKKKETGNTDGLFVSQIVSATMRNLQHNMNAAADHERRSKVFEDGFFSAATEVYNSIKDKEKVYKVVKTIIKEVRHKFKMFQNTANFLLEKSTSFVLNDEYDMWVEDEDDESGVEATDPDIIRQANIMLLLGQSKEKKDGDRNE